jgi:hypothetical protein
MNQTVAINPLHNNMEEKDKELFGVVLLFQLRLMKRKK